MRGTDEAAESPRIAIIGAGPGGICAGIRLRRAGFDRFTIIEKADGVGGTWWHNRYPGAACDVPSHLYSFSFEPKLDWSRPYATQPEILDYFEHCADTYGLRPHLRLGTEVRSAHWDPECLLWRLVTAAGEEIVAEIVISAVGMFCGLNLPDIDGLDSFDGPVVHTARWDPGHDLTGERVAVIGSAASAVQLVPVVAEQVAQLHVFQRSPNWVLPKRDEPYDDAALERFRTDPMAARRLRWQQWRDLEDFITFSVPAKLRAAEQIGLDAISVVEDPDVRAALTPDFPFGSRRPLISDRFYPTFNRPNVELVTDPIAKVTADAVVTADGTARTVDTIVLATGFQTTRYLSVVDVEGRGGVGLADAWSQGAHAYLGMTTPGFPNLFMLYGPNTNNGSILFMLECQVAYVLRHLERMRDERLVTVEVRSEVAEAYNRELQADLDAVEVWDAAYHNYYRGPSGRIVTQWPHTMAEYRRRTALPDDDAYDVVAGHRHTAG